MRNLMATLGMLGLATLAACSYTVELPPDETSSPEARSSVSPSVTASPEDQRPPSRTIAIGTGLKLEAPEDWVPKVPAMSLIQDEFVVPAAEGDTADGRVTVMSAGGSIQQNIDRWLGQFSQPDGSSTADKVKIEKIERAGCEVHLVDVSGTYSDSVGMMAPAVQRPGYRMLAAIIVTPEGNYFVKFYGPEETVERHAEAFSEMIASLGKP